METSELKSAIASRLRLAREQSGLSQGQVARLLGLHRPSVSEVEAGRRSVSATELRQFAQTYGVDVAWLACEDSDADDNQKARLELAARELDKLRPEDLDRVLGLLKAIRAGKETS